MKKLVGLILSAGLMGGLLLTTSCEDDPPVKPKLSFAESSITVNEADGVIEIQVVLDRPALEDFTIDYELGGTATDNEVDPDFADYVVVEDENDYGEVNIAKGETVGVIQIELYSDFDFEDAETIEISILEVDSDLIEITRDDDIEINVEQEDGLLLFLTWDETYTDVDMDLFTWWPVVGGMEIAGGSAAPSFSPPEFIFLHNNIDDGQYGVSCNYYEGTEEPMNFTLSFVPYSNGAFGTEVERNGTYDLGNINPWDVSGIDPLPAATYTKTGSNYSNFSEILIDVNVDGSRVTNTMQNLNIKKRDIKKIDIKSKYPQLFE